MPDEHALIRGSEASATGPGQPPLKRVAGIALED